ncbi:MAG TPA: hypothetical protein VGU22_10430, partial [Methylomirabilota bacterium]|nr:hypothetical protein [Methylomirabilota bacterium]
AGSRAGSARAIGEPILADAERWGVSGGAAVAPPDFGRATMNHTRPVGAGSRAGSARAIGEPILADAERWGVSGGAAVAPPDFN